MKENHRLTTQDIATQMGLSRFTISSVLSGKAAERRISRKTAKRVEDYISKCGFVPSLAGRKLRNPSSRSIGILHSGFLYSHLTEAFNKITNHYIDITENDIECLVVPHKRIHAGVRELLSRGIDRLIWIQAGWPEFEFAPAEPLFNLLRQVRTVIYNYREDHGRYDTLLKDAGISSISVDREEGWSSLASFLKETGHSHVALGISQQHGQWIGRVFLDHKLQVSYLYDDDRTEKEVNLAECFLSHPEKEKIDAVCHIDDEIAGRFMANLIDSGIRIPEDVSVTGFDGMSFGSSLRVPLTTLAIPVSEMVPEIFNLLNQSECGNISIAPELILRSSHFNRSKKEM